MSSAAQEASTRSRRSGVPNYLRPEPARVLHLPAAAWTALVALGLLAAVEVYARFLLDSTFDLVPVSTMATGSLALLGDQEFLTQDLARTLTAIGVAFLLAVLTGPLVAYGMWRMHWFDQALRPYLDVFYAIPIFALYPILVVLFNTGLVPIVLLSWAFGGVVVVSHSAIGFRSVAATVDKLARSLRLSRAQYARQILFPAALPDILTGVKLCLAYVIIAVLATEFILSTSGVGHFISQAYNSFSTNQMYAAILLVTTLALVINLGMNALFNRLDWRQR